MIRHYVRMAALALVALAGIASATALAQGSKACQPGGSALDLLDCHNAKRAANTQSTEEYRVILEKLRWVRKTNLATLEILARVQHLMENHECVDLYQALKMIERGDASLADEDQKALVELKGVIEKDFANRKCATKLSEKARS